VRVADFQPQGLFRALTFIDLYGVDEDTAIETLKAGIQTGRVKPQTRPGFPGPSSSSRPSYPGASMPQGFLRRAAPSAPRAKEPMAINPVYLAAQLDKDDQAQHMFDLIPSPSDLFQDRRRTFGFLVSGAEVHWPQAVNFKAAYGLEEPGSRDPAPEIRPLKHQESRSRLTAEDYLWRLVAAELDCKATPSAIIRALSRPPSKILYRELSVGEVERPELLHGLLAAWGDLPLPKSAPPHLLLLIDNDTDPAAAVDGGPLVQKLASLAPESEPKPWLLPALRPATPAQASDWLKYHIAESLRGDVRKELDAVFADTSEVPHGVLRDRLVALLNQYDL
jgi:hypothetical protein